MRVIQVDVAAPVRLDIALDVGAVSESVEITGVASLLNTESAAQGTVIGEEKIQDGGFSASGNRTNINGFMLDGISNLDPDYMSLSLTPNLDTLVEFQVQTAAMT